MYIYVPEDVELVFQAMEMLINEGDNVAVECPTYSGALAIVSDTLSALVTRHSYARKPFCGYILVMLLLSCISITRCYSSALLGVTYYPSRQTNTA